MATSIDQDLLDRFSEAKIHMDRGDADSALDCMVVCVSAEPAEQRFVNLFLAAIAATRGKKAKEPATPDEAHQELFDSAVAANYWAGILRSGPVLLVTAPTNMAVWQAMSRAAEAEGLPELAVTYLRQVRLLLPAESRQHQQLAEQFTRLRSLDDAIDSLADLEANHPENSPWHSELLTLAIDQMRIRGGLAVHRASSLGESGKTGGGNLRANRKLKQPSPRFFLDSALTPIQQLETAIRDAPATAENYLHIVPLLLEKGRDYDAERILTTGKVATGQDPRVCQLWEEVAMQRMDKRLSAVDDKQESGEQWEELKARRDRLEIEIYRGRCKREPGNLGMQYELGVRFRRAGMLDEAKAAFQQAMTDPQWKSAAAMRLGEFAEEQEDFPLALRCYRQAADAAIEPSTIDARLAALYEAGRLSLQLKMLRMAERSFSAIVALRAGYKDTATLLAAVRGQAD